MLKKVWLFIFLSGLCFRKAYGQVSREAWADSVLQTLSLQKKIGQLLAVPVNASAPAEEWDQISSLITEVGAGTVVITGGGPRQASQRLSQLQQQQELPVLAGMNAEEGLGAVLDSAVIFPHALMLGAVQNDTLLYAFGETLGRQLKLLGIHFSFGPTADLVTSFQREDLRYHSFGENPLTVTDKASAVMRGMMAEGVMPVVKHYPQNLVPGTTKGDALWERYITDTLAVLPLKQLILRSCPAVLTAYQHNPGVPVPASKAVSKKLLPQALPTLYTADYLKKHLGLSGLSFSYLPDVQTVLRKYRPGDAELYAFTAGNDVLLFPNNLKATARKLQREIQRKPALKAQLNAVVKKILLAKYDAGLHAYTVPSQDNLFDRLHLPDVHILNQQLHDASITLAKNEDTLLPLAQLPETPFAALSIGMPSTNVFTHYLSKHAAIDQFHMQFRQDTLQLFEHLKNYPVIIVGLFPYASGIREEYTHLLEKLSQHSKLVICNFSSPVHLPELTQGTAILQAWNDESMMIRSVVQVLFGSASASGKLPLTSSPLFQEGSGHPSATLNRLGYAVPEAMGMDSRMLSRINQVMREAIETKATPGCQVIVARNGKIVFEQTAGWYTYDNQHAVADETLYDLASLTKVAATLQAIMFLEERGLLDVYKKVSVYLPEMRNTNKEDMIIKDVLTHQAGLVPFEPWWPLTLADSAWMDHYYATEKNENYPLKVANGMYVAPHIRDSVWKWTLQSKLIPKADRTPYPYRYSDLSFIILYHLAERLLNQPVEDFLAQNLYQPLGANTLGFLPLQRFDSSRIAPTEYDKHFRKTMIRGTVHDERAAMLGGISGHAGLFGNAHDVAKLGQMFLQQGSYGGQVFYKPETIHRFTHQQYKTSRRGLGWDKPVQSDWNSPTSFWASPQTFGHTGFTGTCLWVDPEFGLVYVFLSNRVYPDRSQKLISSNIRSRIQDIMYQSIFEYCKQNP